ncbi:MAG: respiratory nitrate reductase subunit gamma, partial [Bacteroidales bacterium]|nr:respiratory nitrate reductase subunit gamma [Bacteroidales bacterium]
TMIVGFLGWFQTDNIYEWWHPQRLLGYYATFGLLLGCVYFFIGRIKKDKELNKHSHFTDWTFLILLFLTTLTGILVHFFRIYGMPMATYYMYVIHLMVLFPMLMIEVPFSKWSHLAYRPVAIYFSNILNRAKELQKS